MEHAPGVRQLIRVGLWMAVPWPYSLEVDLVVFPRIQSYDHLRTRSS